MKIPLAIFKQPAFLLLACLVSLLALSACKSTKGEAAGSEHPQTSEHPQSSEHPK